MSRQFNSSEIPYQLSYLLSKDQHYLRCFDSLDFDLKDDIITRSGNITNKYQLQSLERELQKLTKR